MGWDADKETERRAKTKFGWDGSCQQKKDMDGLVLVGNATSSGSILHFETISTVHTQSANSPPSDMVQKLFVMLPSAGVKSTFHLSDRNT